MSLLSILLLAAGGLALWQSDLFRSALSPAGALRDMHGNLVTPDPDAIIDDPTAESDIGLRFKVPSVRLDVPLGQTAAVKGRIGPPGFTSAYWVSNLGVWVENATEGTVYIAAHSLRHGGWAPGNALFDIETQRSMVLPGDQIVVGDQVYSVTETKIIAKPEVGKTGQLWQNTPKRLVVFTCLQNRQNTASTDNMVIIGTLVE
ncbi:MAG: class F sortase [Micrococcales bacterium]|nr:class F sortase [Micrococcales bacterium]